MVSAQLYLDSLYRELSGANGVTKIDLQLSIASRLIFSDKPKADSLVREALSAAESINNIDRIVSSKTILAGIYDRSKADSAELLFLDALKLAEVGVSNKAKAGVHLNYGTLLVQQNRFAEAVTQLTKGAETAAKETRLLNYEIASLMNLGVIMQTIEDFDRAEGYFSNALEKANTPQLEIRKAEILGNLGILEFKKSNYGRSKEYHAQSFAIFNKAQAKSAMAISQLNMGLAETRLNKSVEAKEHFTSALELNKELNNERGVGLVKRYLAEVELSQGNDNMGLNLFTEAEMIFSKFNDHSNLIDVHKNLSEIAENKRNFKDALFHNKMASAFQDSVSRKNKESDINKAIANFEINRMKKESSLKVDLANLKLEKRNRTIFVIVLMSVFSLGLLLWNRFRLRNRLKIEMLNSRLAQQEVLLKTNEFATEKEALANHAERLLKTNETLLLHKQQLESKLTEDQEKKDEVKHLIERLKDSISNEHDWTAFRLYFDKAYPQFFDKLSNQVKTDLTFNEKRLVSLIKIQLTNKEIASALNIQRDSVVKAKIRLKEKLGFNEMKTMEDYIVSIH